MAIFELLLLILIKKETNKTPQKMQTKEEKKSKEKIPQKSNKPTQSSKVVSWEQYFAMLIYLSMC